MNIQVSLIITLYKGIKPSWFEECMESLAKQKDYITELILVEDGEITAELGRTIDTWHKKFPIKSVRLATNQGPGKAAQAGLEKCSCEWVARLDADDLATENRFAIQTEALKKQPLLDVLGGYLLEFNEENRRPFAVNKLPIHHNNIARMMKLRCPINTSSVIFRKQKAMEVGGYETLITHEDYLLWFKMLKAGALFANLPQNIGYFRTNKKSYLRRRGWFAIKHEIIFQNILRKRKYINRFEYVRNIVLRVPPRLLPASLMRIFYIVFLRNRTYKNTP